MIFKETRLIGFFVQGDLPGSGKVPANNTALPVEHQKPGFWSIP
jgi:hypothetical protein